MSTDGTGYGTGYGAGYGSADGTVANVSANDAAFAQTPPRPTITPLKIKPGDQVKVLLAMDSDIRKESGRKRRGAQVIFAIVVVLSLLMLLAAPLIASEVAERNTVAAYAALIIAAGYVIGPIAIGRSGFGLRADHVAHLPVHSGPLRRALLLAMLRSPGSWALTVGIVGSMAWVGEGASKAVAMGLGLLLVALILPLGRVTELLLISAMSSPVGRVVGAVGTVLLLTAAYVGMLMLPEVMISFAGDSAVQGIARALPGGWPVAGAEALGDGRWWLTALVTLGLMLLAGAAFTEWRRRLDRMLEGYITPSSSQKKRTERGTRSVAGSRLTAVIGTEFALLVRDPRRMALMLLPVAFIAVGVFMSLNQLDIYGMRIGAPLVLLLATTPFGNLYGLDGHSSWRVVSRPTDAMVMIKGRTIVAGICILATGVISTIIGHLFVPDADLIPVAAAVLIGGSVALAGMCLVQSMLAPYKVEEGSVGSALTARGSMSGKAFAATLLTLAVGVVGAAPGALVAFLLSGAAAWLGVLISIALATVAWMVLPKIAYRQLLTKGPEVFAVVG